MKMLHILTTSMIRVFDPREHLTPMIGGYKPKNKIKNGGQHVDYIWNLNWLTNFEHVVPLKHVFSVSILRKTPNHIPLKRSSSIEIY